MFRYQLISLNVLRLMTTRLKDSPTLAGLIKVRILRSWSIPLNESGTLDSSVKSTAFSLNEFDRYTYLPRQVQDKPASQSRNTRSAGSRTSVISLLSTDAAYVLQIF
jgi:hypothetical protein